MTAGGSIRRWGPPLVGLALAACAYGLFARLATYPPDAPPGLWNIVLDVACSPQFLTYVVFPFWIVVAAIACARATSSVRRLRLGSDGRAIRAAAGQLGRVLIAGAVAVCLGAVLAAIGLPLRAVPLPDSAAGRYFSIGVPPVVALAAQAALTAAMLMAVALLLVALHIRWGSWPLLVTVAACLFAWVAASANGLILGWPSLTSSIDAAVVISGMFPVALACLVAAALVPSGYLLLRDAVR